MDLAYYTSELKPVSAFNIFFMPSKLFAFLGKKKDKIKHYRTGGDVEKIDV